MNCRRLRIRTLTVAVATLATAALAPAVPAAGQVAEESPLAAGITVHGSGEELARPNSVEIDLRASASAELTADAIVKYSDAKRRTLEAFDGLKMDELKIKEAGLSLTPGNAQEAMQMAMRGMAGTTPYKMQVQIGSTLHVRLGGIQDLTPEQVMETIGKLLDTAQDSGAAVGPSQEDINMAWRYGNQLNGAIVRFVVRDLDSLRESAYERAVADARKRAERLARLNNVQLGQVLAVHELFVSGEDASVSPQWAGYPQAQRTTPTGDPQIVSETFSEVPFRVKLRVRFAIKNGEQQTASTE